MPKKKPDDEEKCPEPPRLSDEDSLDIFTEFAEKLTPLHASDRENIIRTLAGWFDIWQAGSYGE